MLKHLSPPGFASLLVYGSLASALHWQSTWKSIVDARCIFPITLHRFKKKSLKRGEIRNTARHDQEALEDLNGIAELQVHAAASLPRSYSATFKSCRKYLGKISG